MSFFNKLHATIDKGLTHARAEVIGRWNPNRRHDDPHEIEADKVREEINKSHRFESFADVREGNCVKWHIDGHDYMYALSLLLDSAQECIFILDWWLTPELYLRRPAASHPEWRLDRVLKRKAEEGVKIHIVVYKEVTQTMSMSSKHTKNYLEGLHEGIMVFRHPDHVGSKDTVEFWSHHEKVVVIDNHLACIGGLDLCFGRWDTHNHPLADIHPTDFSKTLFPGQDYNNARVMDFKDVYNYASNGLNGLEVARMAWHDVHMTLTGPVVLDISQHFIERWNEIKKRKYRNDEQYPWLSLPHNVDVAPNESVARHPHLESWREIGHQYKQRWHRRYYGGVVDEDDEDEGGSDPREDRRRHPRPHPGTCRVQVVRSVSDWSHGVLTEHSIQNAYKQMIEEAEHFVYIENQFFISATQPGGQVTNLIAQAIVNRVVRAAKEGKKFKVIIAIPEVPGFAGNVKDESSLKVIMAAQYRTINRGGSSIYEEIRKAGYEPMDWVRFYHLRGWDRINGPVGSLIHEMEKHSGVTFHEAQVALARQWIGEDMPSSQTEVTLAAVEVGKASVMATEAGAGAGLGKPEGADKDKDKDKSTVTVPIPATVEEARQTVKRFEDGSIPIRDDENVKDSLAFHANLAGQPARSFGAAGEEVRGYEGYGEEGVEGELWVASEQEEREAYVSELRYIHTKLMIVDDRRVIMGSANINDRSQKGDGDSEIALVVEDGDMIESYMNGQPYQASRFAATLRRKLFREHLGLIPPQHCFPDSPVTSFMKPAPVPNADETRTRWDDMVSDPLGEETWALWNETARRNREVFTELFRIVPSNLVRDWKGWENYVPKDTKYGHVVPGIPLDRIKKQLAQVRGAVVECPLDFLIDDKDFVTGPEWRGLNPTLPIYI